MAVRKLKPTSAGRRFQTVSDFAEITRTTPEKSLTVGLTKKAGRNNRGRVTSRRRGGGVKRLYRIIDFKRNKFGIAAKVAHIEYDPNRTARIALLHYVDGEKRYIIAPVGLKQGDVVLAGEGADIKPGNAMQMSRIPVGTVIHNVELYPGKGGQLCRAAGTYAQLVAKEGKYALLRRSAQGAGFLRGHCGPGGQHPARKHLPGQGRPQPLAGSPSSGPRCGHEPHRPSPGRWRRPQLRWSSSRVALGYACQGLQDPRQEQGFFAPYH